MRTRWIAATAVLTTAALAGSVWLAVDWLHERKLDRIRVVEMSWRRVGVYGMRVDYDFRNENAFDVTDIEVLCRHRDEADKVIDQNRRTLPIVISAGGTLHVPDYPMGWISVLAKSSSCRVTKFREGSSATPPPAE